MLLFQYLQDADMSDTPRAAAGKDETYTGAMRRRGGSRRSCVRRLLRNGDGRSGEPESRAENAVYPETGPDRPW
jgi:hypothetical protein